MSKQGVRDDPQRRRKTGWATQAMDAAVISAAEIYGCEAVQAALLTHAVNAAMLEPTLKQQTISLLKTSLELLENPQSARLAMAKGVVGVV